MERGSDKHGARLDDAMAEEVEGLVRGGHQTHAEEWKEAEPSGEDQPDADLIPDGTAEGGTPDGMSAADVETRSTISTYLGKEIYPATGEQLVAKAEENEATDDVLSRLRALPQSRTFTNLQEVWAELGGGVEEHRS